MKKKGQDSREMPQIKPKKCNTTQLPKPMEKFG
jgi:hypothetical protein